MQPTAPCEPGAFGTVTSRRPIGEREYRTMVIIYEQAGGLLDENEAVCLLRRHVEQPIGKLARWLVERRIVFFRWKFRTFIPVFQFERREMTLRKSLAPVLAELTDVFDDWAVALWFAQPNSWLDGSAPAAVLADKPEGVQQAARADRFIACG